MASPLDNPGAWKMQLLEQEIGRAPVSLPTYQGGVGREATAASNQASQAYGKEAQALQQDVQQVQQAYNIWNEGVQIGHQAAQDKINADAARSQAVAANFDAANKLFGFSLSDAESRTARMAAEINQVDEELIRRAGELRQSATAASRGDVLGVLDNMFFGGQRVAEYNRLAQIGNSMQQAINTSVASAQAAGNAANLAIPSITADMQAAQLKGEEARVKAAQAELDVSRIKTSGELRGKAVANIAQRASTIMSLDNAQRDERYRSFSSQVEAAKYAASEQQRRLSAKMAYADLLESKKATESAIEYVNVGLDTMGLRNITNDAELRALKENGKLFDQVLSAAASKRIGATPADAYANMQQTGTALGSAADPVTRSTLGLVASTAQQAQERIAKSSAYQTADKNGKVEVMKKGVNDAIAARFVGADKSPELRVLPPSDLFTNPAAKEAFGQYPISEATVRAAQTVSQGQAKPDAATVAKTIADSLAAKGGNINKIRDEINNYFLGATAVRNKGIDAERFGFDNVKEIKQSMNSYVVEVRYGWGDTARYDMTNPTQVSEFLIRQRRAAAGIDRLNMAERFGINPLNQ